MTPLTRGLGVNSVALETNKGSLTFIRLVMTFLGAGPASTRLWIRD